MGLLEELFFKHTTFAAPPLVPMAEGALRWLKLALAHAEEGYTYLEPGALEEGDLKAVSKHAPSKKY